jgi:hypothetical protein
MISITRVAPMAGTDAEPLWREGEASYVNAGLGRHVRVTYPPPDLVGWLARVDGEAAGLQACRLPVGLPEAHGMLSWVRPAHRGAGVFAAIQAAVDAELLAEGRTHIRSWVVAGPEEAGMAAAIIARGGARIGVETIETEDGRSVRYAVFLRPLRA